ncbi:transglutaminase-like cysteine peptidase [Flexibacterium corallicola]|uniref:transglutaminase-like cysteine peptidase n=1 Tax=Flexibacterium corallicola TaxID=3037259 RepID=UPI00286EFAEB|nr:transglutaminase-like cysteine peptidase [Pseudovibrio sp. M1P-2-3]
MPMLGETPPPIGHVNFCIENSHICNTTVKTAKIVALTQTKWKQLHSINRQVNQKIVPATDENLFKVPEYWTYPTSGAGDCEEYVLEKQRSLIKLGWPASALLITVVKDTSNDGHAVLVVRTDLGDLVLDNLLDPILPWYSTPYRFVKRQSSYDPAKWSAISDRRVTTVATIED